MPLPASRTRKISPCSARGVDAVLAGQRVVGGGDDDVGVRADDGGLHGQILGRLAHDGEIERMVPQPGDGFGAVADGEAQFEPGVAAGKGAERARGEVFGGAGDARADRTATGAGEIGEDGFALAEDDIDAAGGGRDLPPRIGQHHAGGAADDQRQAGFVLQRLELEGDRGGCEVQCLGGAGDRAGAGEGGERAKLTESGVAHD